MENWEERDKVEEYLEDEVLLTKATHFLAAVFVASSSKVGQHATLEAGDERGATSGLD